MIPDNSVTSQVTSKMVMNMSGLTRAGGSDDARVFVFNGAPGADRGHYNHRIVQITRAGNLLTMPVPVGTWDVFLVSTVDGSGLDRLVSPVYNQARASMKMLELTPTNGLYTSAPELVTGRVDDQQIDPDQTKNAHTDLSRNVAMVKLVINDPKGLNPAGLHTVTLGNIPTTLGWDGGLWPDKNNPAVSAPGEAMLGSLTITDLGGGMQKSDTVTFLIPAHKGSDFMSPSPQDTTTSLLTLAVKVSTMPSGLYESQTVTIPVAPKANKILVVRMNVSGELRVESDILPWADEYFDYDVKNPYSKITVNKTEVTMAVRDTLLVDSNLGQPAVTVGDNSWLTATYLPSDPRKLILKADTETFTGVKRRTWVDLTVDNMTKRIWVIQAIVGHGTISASPATVWVSPNTTDRTINVSGSTFPWEVPDILLPANVDITGTNGQDGSGGQVHIRRKSYPFDNGIYDVYGNDTLYVRNTHTMEVAPVVVQNLYMRGDDIAIGNPRLTNDTTVWSGNIDILGGSRRFTVVNKPYWVTTAECVANPDPTKYGDAPWIIKLVGERDPDEEERIDTITVAHYDDPTYRIKVAVTQEVIVTIPAFDYFTVNYTWVNNDVDIAFRFAGNSNSALGINVPFDGFPVGYAMYNASGASASPYGSKSVSHVYSPGQVIRYPTTTDSLLRWGGDNTGGYGETAFFNAPIIEHDANLPRKIKMEAWATWYTQNRRGSPVTLTMRAYLGGEMFWGNEYNSPTATYIFSNFYNRGGTELYNQQVTVLCNGSSQSASSHFGTNPTQPLYPEGDQMNGTTVVTRSFALLATIEYDRVKHSARMTAIAPAATRAMYVTPIPAPYDPKKVTPEDLEAEQREKEAITRASINAAIQANMNNR